MSKHEMPSNELLNKLDEHCKRNKILLSENKKAVFLTLLQSGKEVEAEELYLNLVSDNRFRISMATVYIALNWLADIGIVAKTKNKRANLYRINNIELV